MPVLVILLGHFNSLNAVIGEVDDQSRFLKQQLAVASGLPVKSWLRRRLTTCSGESGFQRECRISRAAARSCQRLLGIQIVFPEGSQVADGSAEVSRINIQLNRWVALPFRPKPSPELSLQQILIVQLRKIGLSVISGQGGGRGRGNFLAAFGESIPRPSSIAPRAGAL
ncbi:MAG: hypothetical protein V5B32_07950 [Candidatus Accumulibacter sp. UW26]|jgi:hypothetical protein